MERFFLVGVYFFSKHSATINGVVFNLMKIISKGMKSYNNDKCCSCNVTETRSR